MSFTTRQLAANRVNHMPGTPVTCQVTNYTLKEFDGVIKGTNENNGNAENLRCANGGILNINDTTLDPAIIDIDGTIDNNTNKLVLIGARDQGNAAKTLTVDGTGALSVKITDGGGGAVTNAALTKLGDSLVETVDAVDPQNRDDPSASNFLAIGGRVFNEDPNGDAAKPPIGDTNDFKELQVDNKGVLSVKITDGGFGGDISNDNLDKLNFNGVDDLKVVDSNISSASENTKIKNVAGEDVNVNDKTFLVIGGRSDNRDLDGGKERVPAFKELKVDETGVLSVNISGGGGGAVTNDGLNNLNSALHDYNSDKDDGKDKDKLLSIGVLDENDKYVPLQTKGGVLSVSDDGLNNLNNALHPDGGDTDGTDKLLAIGVLGDDNKYTTLKLNDQGELKVNGSITSAELTQMASATVEADNPNASPGHHFSVSGKYTGENNNISYEPIKVDDNGVVCVKTQGTNVVKTENDVLTSLNDVIFENDNEKYLRVSTDQVDGILMKGNDAAGGSTNQTISLVQGAILPAQVQNIITKPRLLTANIGRNISYSYSNDLENLNGGNGFTNPTDINGRDGGTLSSYIGKILITTNNFPTTEGSMINVYVRIICPDGTVDGEVDPRPFTIYILGGIINTGDQFYNQRDSLVLDSIKIDDTYEPTIKFDNTTVDTIYHTFKLNMPFVKGGGLGISSSKDLDNVYVGMSYPEY